MEEARQINENLVVFFKLLKKWDRESKKKRMDEGSQEIPLEQPSEDEILDSKTKPGTTIELAEKVPGEVLHTKNTTDGVNISNTVGGGDEVEGESDQEQDTATARLITHFEMKSGKLLTEDEARDILDFLSDD